MIAIMSVDGRGFIDCLREWVGALLEDELGRDEDSAGRVSRVDSETGSLEREF